MADGVTGAPAPAEPVAWMHEFTDPHSGNRYREPRLHKPADFELQPGDTVRPLAYADGVAPAQAPNDDCVAIGGLKGRTVAYAVYAGSENGTASVQFFFNDGTGFVISASGKKDVLNFRPVEQIPGSLAAGVSASDGQPQGESA